MSVAFSPDGQRLASARTTDREGVGRRTGQEIRTLKGHTAMS